MYAHYKSIQTSVRTYKCNKKLIWPIPRSVSWWAGSDATILGVGCGVSSCGCAFGNMSGLGGLIREHLLQLGAPHVAHFGPVSLLHISPGRGAPHG